jgi:RimJ/RimL family protein N-acetyltransferase
MGDLRGDDATTAGAGRRRLRLVRIADDGGDSLARILRNPAVAPTGFAERDAEPHELLGPGARVWRLDSGGLDAGVLWLDQCLEHDDCLECGMYVRKAGRGSGPRALLAAVMYAFDRLAVRSLCFAAKEYNRPVIAMCRRVGLLPYDQQPYPDDFHPSGLSDLVYYLVRREDVERNRRRCRALLRTPVAVIGRSGAVEYVASPDRLPA